MLIVNCSGLAAEIVKNIALAGVGSIVLVDDRPLDKNDPTNFLVAEKVGPNITVAEASVASLKEMNPHIKISSLCRNVSRYITPKTVAGFHLVVLIGQPFHTVAQADAACKEAGVPFIAAGCHEQSGWVFSNLQNHHFDVESSKEQKNGTVLKTIEKHSIQGVPLREAVLALLPKRIVKRKSPFLFVFLAIAQFELEHNRKAEEDDIDLLMDTLIAACEKYGLSAEHAKSFCLPEFIKYKNEFPATNAILGGCVANDIVKIVTRKGEPLINNLCLYSMLDGAGWVERLG